LDSILRLICIGLGLLSLYLVIRLIARRWAAYRYRDVNADAIQAGISKMSNHESQLRGSLTLTANGSLLLHVNDVDLGELARQLEEWSTYVDDIENCREFSFYVENEPETIGMLRIIPRQIGWQINSIRRRSRRTKPISLDAHLAMAKSIVEQVKLLS